MATDYVPSLSHPPSPGFTSSSAGSGVEQTIPGSFDDPNSNVTPDDTTKGALYYKDDPSEVNQWRWSVDDQVWYPNIQP